MRVNPTKLADARPAQRVAPLTEIDEPAVPRADVDFVAGLSGARGEQHVWVGRIDSKQPAGREPHVGDRIPPADTARRSVQRTAGSTGCRSSRSRDCGASSTLSPPRREIAVLLGQMSGDDPDPLDAGRVQGPPSERTIRGRPPTGDETLRNLASERAKAHCRGQPAEDDGWKACRRCHRTAGTAAPISVSRRSRSASAISPIVATRKTPPASCPCPA